jgi:adenosylcobalamin-dependent ribonucleoside-triphosphate reductase
MPDGELETWSDTVRRVVKGNLSLVPSERIEPGEEDELYNLIYNFRALPAGRHLWMSGVEGRQFLFNCYVSGWGDRLSEHFAFTFNQLMEGGGVGANYSSKYLDKYSIGTLINVEIVCSPEHDDYEDLKAKGLLSTNFHPDYTGAIEVDDSREGWVSALTQVIDESERFTVFSDDVGTLVYDVSNIRASGKRIKTFGGTSAGPVPFARMLLGVSQLLREAWEVGVSGPIAMAIDHVIATCVVSGNVRRSARMSIMHWRDPYIEWFLECKKDLGKHWSTNISVEIDDEFTFLLSKFKGWDQHSTFAPEAQAQRIYEKITEGMLRDGEPGIWNSSLSNKGEPNPVIATNPCGEIALEAWENCNLGHINLDAFVESDGIVDIVGLYRAHELITRFLIRATFGDISDDKTRATNARNRRIGVGHFGFAGFVAKQKIRFSDSWKMDGIREILFELSVAVDVEAESYAHQLRIPVPVKKRTVAPTGTIAKLAGRSEGIHPVYARYFIRRIRYSTVDPRQIEAVEEYKSQGYNVVVDPDTENTVVVEIPTKEALVQELEDLDIDPSYLESVDEISLYDMLKVQDMYQTLWADNAVSYTVNIPDGKIDPEDFRNTLKPFLADLKGTTVFPDRSRALSPYERVGYSDYVALRGSQEVVDDSYDEACASGACPVR